MRYTKISIVIENLATKVMITIVLAYMLEDRDKINYSNYLIGRASFSHDGFQNDLIFNSFFNTLTQCNPNHAEATCWRSEIKSTEKLKPLTLLLYLK